MESKEATIQMWVSRWHKPIVLRREIHRFTDGMVCNRQCEYDDNIGLGPKPRLKIVGSVAYPLDAVAEWLHRRIQVMGEKG